MDRRTFLARIVQLFSVLIAALLSLPIFRFLSASLAEEQSGWYPLTATDSLSEEVTQVTVTRMVRDGWLSRSIEEYVWVRKKPDGSFVVYEPHCTHLGCAYAWNPDAKQFQCPCHGGKFDINGKRIAGPPPRPLDRYEVRVDGNTLKIGKVIKA